MKMCRPTIAMATVCAVLGVLAFPRSWTLAQSVPQPPARTGPTTSRPELQAQSAAPKVLLVDHDESDNNSNPASGNLSASDVFYRKLLTDQGLSFDTVVVPRYSDGPPLEKLKGYGLIVWYTGASYGGNRDNTAVVSVKDEESLTSYLRQTSGTVLLVSPGYLNNALGAGGSALWAKKESPFLQQVLGIKGGRGLLQRFRDGTVASKDGATYAVTKSPTVETQFSAANPGQAETLFTATLDPDGTGPQAVAVATRQHVGAGTFVYVGFTLENIAVDAGRAFAALVPTIGTQVAGRSAPGPEPATAFSAKRASTSPLSVTGTGVLTEGPAFVAKQAGTPPLTVTGTGLLAEGAAFVAKQAGTPALTVTGTGSLQ